MEWSGAEWGEVGRCAAECRGMEWEMEVGEGGKAGRCRLEKRMFAQNQRNSKEGKENEIKPKEIKENQRKSKGKKGNQRKSTEIK